VSNKLIARLPCGSVLGAVMLLASCAVYAPIGDDEVSAPAAPVAASSVRALPIVAVAAAQLTDYWHLRDEPAVRAVVSSGNSLQLGCVALNFGIDADGRTFDIQVRKSWPQGRFADHALGLIKGWQYVAVDSNPIHQPVRSHQMLTLQAVGNDVRLVNAEQVAKFCR